ncbi:MAG: tRNA epoxyqueuosine(34) reductase QueG [Elusimicrobia bacterium RIFCSPHIGHO2_02_FULL_57_9]|nr:MAG: tRNA epoxyqueuosine(34) reductase QueG [Elusimicrobia bacterium RIFCSPHIGHO2_02_FULL_57_9]
MELAAELKKQALQAGAALAGIAPAQPLPQASAYEKWIAAGMQGGMDYMARNAQSRKDIAHWYPEAKSVLICGFSYASTRQASVKSGYGRLARYSVFPDYHPELKKRMKSILDWLKTTVPKADGRIFVDTSPLLERLYARYAGVGFVGKNTMLIAPKLGSYFLIAGLAINIELASDEPVPDHCGSCNRCLNACPTDAFAQERVLDAGRCIAYFTIEHRGGIPEEFRPGIGDWIMGCDVCQEVCPWNRFALAGEVFKPQFETSQDLAELARMDNAAFKKRFGKTPLSRAKRRGIVRNALLAMGNSRDLRYRPLLERARSDPDPILSEQATWSLARLLDNTQS